MMALFIVLWLLNTSDSTRKLIGGYFLDPLGKGHDVGTGMHGSGETVSLKNTDMAKLKQQIEQALKKMPQFQALKNQVRLTVTGEGLRIEMLENETGIFFDSGSAQPTEKCRALLALLATQLGSLPNKLLIEGHTDSRPFNNGEGYTNWELSTDRANAARRLMLTDGIRRDQVAQVRGFADQNLLIPKDPANASNRRVSVIVQYVWAATELPVTIKSAAQVETPTGNHPSASNSAPPSHPK
jgi:chemotaxis protein MotB